MKSYRVKDRVNSSRGVGVDPWNPDREIRRATGATEQERAAFAADAFGALIFPASVVEVRPNGQLPLEYDGGGRGLEWQSNVTPRQAMPWHPRDVPLHLMLRRNVGRGRKPVEGLQVRWNVVSKLLQALCSLPRNGAGPWRQGGQEAEPMHKHYDPKLFDVLDEREKLSLIHI